MSNKLCIYKMICQYYIHIIIEELLCFVNKEYTIGFITYVNKVFTK